MNQNRNYQTYEVPPGGYNQGYQSNQDYKQGYQSNQDYNQGYQNYNQGYKTNKQGYETSGGYNQGYSNQGELLHSIGLTNHNHVFWTKLLVGFLLELW